MFVVISSEANNEGFQMKKVSAAILSIVFSQSTLAITREEAVNNWVEKNGQQEWGLCSATSIEIRGATAGTASDSLTQRLNMVDGVMRMARVRLTQKGISSSSLDNIQQAAFNANKAKDAKAKGLIFNNCVGTVNDAAQGK